MKKIDYLLSIIQLYSYKLPTVKIGNAIMDFRERFTIKAIKRKERRIKAREFLKKYPWLEGVDELDD